MQQPSLKYYASLLNVLIFNDGCDNSNFLKLSKKLFNSVEEHAVQDQSAQYSKESYHLLVLIGDDDFLKNLDFNLFRNIHIFNTLVLSTQTLAICTYQYALTHKAYHVDSLSKNENEFVVLMRSALPPLVENFHLQNQHRRYEEIVEDGGLMYIVYEEAVPIYISKAVKETFEVESLDEYAAQKMNIQITPCIEKNSENFTKNIYFDEQNYQMRGSSFEENRVLVHLTKIDVQANGEQSMLLNRLSFIEELKDTFISRTFEAQTTPLIIINVDNFSDIVKDQGVMVYHDILVEFSELIKGLCNGNIQLSQWAKNVLCVLTPSRDVEQLSQEMKKIQDAAAVELNTDGVQPLFRSYTIDINTLDLNRVVELIDNIDDKKLTQNSLSNLAHFEISSSTNNLENEKDILYYLEKQMLSKLEVKLLNFYKGLSINTPARLVKIDGENVYIRQEKIQAYAMKLDGQVLIQSAHIPMDILAKVKLIDINKKVAILSDFEALKESANNRRHIRVSSDHRMHVSLSSKRNVFSATVLDISIKSMACRVSLGKKIPEVGSKIKAQFQLPSKRFDEEMVSMNMSTKVAFVIQTQEYIKLVLDLELCEPYESYLLEYIYERQQTLIKEIKQIALKL